HEGKIILRELTDESNTTGYIPADHLNFLPYTSKRHKKGWLAPHINQREYVKHAVKLAMRKHQAKKTNFTKTMYIQEIDTLRNKIYTLLFREQSK
ncbi:MAG: hypothetical protein N2510_09865, partial [Ignavibacteria bacterium]|nr:hypothetical protein [Ignavibacteria bacterium]